MRSDHIADYPMFLLFREVGGLDRRFGTSSRMDLVLSGHWVMCSIPNLKMPIFQGTFGRIAYLPMERSFHAQNLTGGCHGYVTNGHWTRDFPRFAYRWSPYLPVYFFLSFLSFLFFVLSLFSLLSRILDDSKN